MAATKNDHEDHTKYIHERMTRKREYWMISLSPGFEVCFSHMGRGVWQGYMISVGPFLAEVEIGGGDDYAGHSDGRVQIQG